MILKIVDILAQITGNKWFKVLIRIIIAAFVIYITISFLSQKSQSVIPDTNMDSSFRQETDKNGKLIAVINAQELQIISQNKMVDSLARALRLKTRNIQAVDRYIIRTDTIIKDSVIVTRFEDTVIFHKKDNYLDLTGFASSEKNWIELKLTDTIFRVENRHTPIFRTPYSQIYLTNANPYSKIVAGNVLKITSPKPMITIGPSFGWDPLSGKIVPAISVQIPVITIYRK